MPFHALEKNKTQSDERPQLLFNKPLQEVEYNKLSRLQVILPATINLAFLETFDLRRLV